MCVYVRVCVFVYICVVCVCVCECVYVSTCSGLTALKHYLFVALLGKFEV